MKQWQGRLPNQRPLRRWGTARGARDARNVQGHFLARSQAPSALSVPKKITQTTREHGKENITERGQILPQKIIAD